MADPRLAVGICAALVFTLAAVTVSAAAGVTQLVSTSKVTARVQNISKASAAIGSRSGARYDSLNRLQIDVEFDCARATPTAALRAAGMVVGTTVKIPPLCVVEGWATVSDVPSLSALAVVKRIDLPRYSLPHPPMQTGHLPTIHSLSKALGVSGLQSIDGNGISIMNVDKYIQQTNVTGAEVPIGVVSDDVASLAMIQSRGELPMVVNVIQPSANPTAHAVFTDEGTMMLEEVYSVAPGATLYFCGPATATEYFACVQTMMATGVLVISDDLSYLGFDVMSAPAENQVGAALGNLLALNPAVMLFHSVGNDALDYWQGAYDPTPGAQSCAASGQPVQTDAYLQIFGGTNAYVNWTTNGDKPLVLASYVAAGQATANSFDIYVYDPVASQMVACSTAASGGTSGSTSYTVVDRNAVPAGTYQIFIGSADASLSGTYLKLIGSEDGGGAFAPSTPGAPSSFQDFTAGVITVGAVDGLDGIGNSIEAYSDTGPLQFAVGNPSTLQAPSLVAPDDVYVDVAGTLYAAIEYDGEFTGTSAASPNAAAVSALIRSAFPTLTPAEVTTALEAGAAPFGLSSPSATFGYGRVDAIGALAVIPGPSVTGLQGLSIVGGTTPPVLPFTVGGTGVIKISAVASIGASGSGAMGVTISPADCGNDVSACTLTLAPSVGSFGTATVQMTATDGAGRTQSPQISVVLVKPKPPSLTITTGGSQSVVINGAITPLAFVLTGTGALVVTPTATNLSGYGLSPGCGSSALTCAFAMGAAMSTAGTASVTLTVTDAYGQSASASATVAETNPPSSGGGGAVTWWTLLALAGLVLVRRGSPAIFKQYPGRS